jgi:hypothetical protein
MERDSWIDHTSGFQERVSIFERATSHKWSLKYTYLRNYFAAKWVGWMGWLLDIFTAVVGAVLIYMLTREGNPDFPLIEQLSSLTPADLAVVILFSSLVSSFYGPKLRSRKYYNAGQEHQQLYDEFVDFIEIEVTSLENGNEQMRKRLDELNNRRHRLNQSTPRLGGIWYYSMQIWSWLTDKVSKTYVFFAPWKETPDTIHPCRESDEAYSPSPEEQFLEKLESKHP